MGDVTLLGIGTGIGYCNGGGMSQQDHEGQAHDIPKYSHDYFIIHSSDRLNIIGIPLQASTPFGFAFPFIVWIDQDYRLSRAYKIISMSLKYRRSILFDQPEQTTAKIALQSLVFDYKQRLQLNSRTNSESGGVSPQRMTAGQARYIEGLQEKLKTISFHTLYKQYHKNAVGEELHTLDPQKMQMFRSGKFYRCSHRPKQDEVICRQENRKKEMNEYFQRHPQEEAESATEVKIKNKPKSAQLGKGRAFHSTKKF